MASGCNLVQINEKKSSCPVRSFAKRFSSVIRTSCLRVLDWSSIHWTVMYTGKGRRSLAEWRKDSDDPLVLVILRSI